MSESESEKKSQAKSTYKEGFNLFVKGQIEDAIDCLERTVKVGAAYKDWMMNDTDLDPLREEPRFRKLVESLG